MILNDFVRATGVSVNLRGLAICAHSVRQEPWAKQGTKEPKQSLGPTEEFVVSLRYEIHVMDHPPDDCPANRKTHP